MTKQTKCIICGKDLTDIQIKRKQETCSRSCTNIRRYQNPEVRQRLSDSVKQAYQNPEVKFYHKNKMKQWYEENCRTEEYLQNMRVGVKKAYENEEVRKHVSESVRLALSKPEVKQKLSKSLKAAYQNPELHKKISDATKNALSKPEIKERQVLGIRNAYKLNKETMLQKQYNTKRKNNSFKSSKSEQIVLKLLQQKFNKVESQYRSDLYLFNCDFYIEDINLFIELHFTWTHGHKPFDESDQFCINQLNEWKEKAKTSKFYQNAIYTWTDLDVRKLQTFKDNKLNYKIFYNWIEFIKWYDMI